MNAGRSRRAALLLLLYAATGQISFRSRRPPVAGQIGADILGILSHIASSKVALMYKVASSLLAFAVHDPDRSKSGGTACIEEEIGMNEYSSSGDAVIYIPHIWADQAEAYQFQSCSDCYSKHY